MVVEAESRGVANFENKSAAKREQGGVACSDRTCLCGPVKIYLPVSIHACMLLSHGVVTLRSHSRTCIPRQACRSSGPLESTTAAISCGGRTHLDPGGSISSDR
jgi:hypothetical protein